MHELRAHIHWLPPLVPLIFPWNIVIRYAQYISASITLSYFQHSLKLRANSTDFVRKLKNISVHEENTQTSTRLLCVRYHRLSSEHQLRIQSQASDPEACVSHAWTCRRKNLTRPLRKLQDTMAKHLHHFTGTDQDCESRLCMLEAS